MQQKVVLVVDDNPDELMIYTTVLSHRGYAVLAARSFEAALVLAREERPAAAVVDVNLGDPRQDGCDLIAALARDPGTAGIRVLAHTAFGDLYQQALTRAGCSNVLHKPTTPRVLADAVEALIGGA